MAVPARGLRVVADREYDGGIAGAVHRAAIDRGPGAAVPVRAESAASGGGGERRAIGDV